jgi:transposase
MANYKKDNSKQNMFVPIMIDEQLIPGTIEYAIAHIVDNYLDLSSFDLVFSNDNGGATAYPPSIMLKIIFYAYSLGLLSSRRIARACQTNITFMCLSGDVQPHYTSIAAFITHMSKHIQPLFTQVLMTCEQQGLIGGNMFAIDGCKIPSNASKEWSGTHAELTRKKAKLERASQRIVERHQALDGKPDEHIDSELKQKAKLDECAKKIETFLASSKEKLGARKQPVKSNITDNDSAKMTTSKGTIQGYNGIAISDDKNQIIMQAEAWGSVGEQQTLPPAVNQLLDTLDTLGLSKNNAKFTADSGFNSAKNLEFLNKKGLDAYIADNGFRSRNPLFQNSETYQTHQANKRKNRSKTGKTIYSLSLFNFDKVTNTCRCPAGKVMRVLNKKACINGQLGITFCGHVRDCRDCVQQSQCMRNPVGTQRGRQVFFRNDIEPEFNYIEMMKAKIDSPEGRRQYSKRLGAIEPVFGNITINKGMDRFTLRGKTKVNAQWQTYCLIHNIEKLRNYIH